MCLIFDKSFTIVHDIHNEFSTRKMIRYMQKVNATAIASIVGKRKTQEDSAICGKIEHIGWSENFVVICDGMGGLQHGQIASTFCVERIKKAISQEHEWNTTPDLLCTNIELISELIYRFTDQKGVKLDCGTTVAVATVCKNQLYWACAGDSRVYIYSGSRLKRITHDHNYGYKKYSEGKPVDQYSNNHKALISYVGMEDVAIIDVNLEAEVLDTGSIILVCSDGVTDTLDDLSIEEILRNLNGMPPEDIVNAVIEKVESRQNNHQDNATVGVIIV